MTEAKGTAERRTFGDIRSVRSSRRTLFRAAGAGALGIAARPLLGGAGQHAMARQLGSVLIYPPAGTYTASPNTEISFRGITADELGHPTIVAGASGGHSGIFSEHADGNGVSFVLDAAFEPGEIVTVTAPGLPEPHTFGVVRPSPLVSSDKSRVEDEPETEPQTFVTRPDLLPPAFEITDSNPGTSDGYVFVTSNQSGGQRGLTILDNNGDIVWFQPRRVATDNITDFRAQEYQGQPVLTWIEGSTPLGFGYAHFVIADSTYERIVEVQAGNGFAGGDLHEFLLTPRGTALVILYQPVEWDLTPVGGSPYGAVQDNIIQEIEIETGHVLYEWHSLDHVGVEETMRTYDPGGVGVIFNDPLDYFHMNSVEEDPDGNFIISARHTWGIYKIDRATNEVIWRLGGTNSDFEMGEGTEFAYQHDARVHANGELTLFDNHEANQDLGDTTWSRGLVLDLDEEAMTATLVREYIHPTEILSVSQANMQVLPNGNVFIGWGSAPVFSEFSEDGELLFNGRFAQGTQSYRAYRFDWTGEPDEPPAIAAETGAAGGLTVYASWNGATEVESWRVLAGAAPTTLFEVASAPRDGFETEIEVDTSESYVAVEALDAGGSIIGASEAIETGIVPATPAVGG